jgi:hypothetical protein
MIRRRPASRLLYELRCICLSYYTGWAKMRGTNINISVYLLHAYKEIPEV